MKKILLIIFISFSTINLFSQGVTVFESEVKNDKNKTESNSDYKNALKFGVFNLIRGEFAFFYERKLNSFFTAEVGAGITFFNTVKNYGGSIISEVIGFDTFEEMEEMEEFNTTKLSIGPAFQGIFKVFPAGDAMDGFYFGLNARYSRFNDYHSAEEAHQYFDNTYSGYYNYYNVTNIETEEFKSYSRYADFMITVGREQRNYSETFFYEWYIGVGLRSVSSRNITRDVENVYDFSNGYQSIDGYSYTYSLGLTKTSLLPTIGGGLKIGGFW